MHRLRAAVALALALPALSGCFGHASDTPPTASPPPAHAWAPLTKATHKLGAFVSATVASFDGTPLHVDVQLPDGKGPFPAILVDTPYSMIPDGPLVPEDVSGAQADAGMPFDGDVASQYVPYGYAVAVAHVRGTGESGGCLTVGGPEEGRDGYALVEWLANQTWSSGKVGMTGTSWDGTTPLETAVLRPPHLATIVPVSPVTEWYRYYFELGAHRRNADPPPGSSDTDPATGVVLGGLPGARTHTVDAAKLACVAQFAAEDDGQDDYDAYWHARDHHAHAGNITASMLFEQGWLDGNVATTGFPLLWANVTAQKRIWLQQNEHGIQPGTFQAYTDYVHRWFDHWLLGLDNGAMELPAVVTQDNTGKYRSETDWPPRDAQPRVFSLAAGGKLDDGAGGATATAAWHDDGTGSEDAKLDGVDHLTFASAPLAAPLHLAGTPSLALTASSDMPDTQLDVKLYDQAPDGTRTLVTRGFLDARHRDSLDHGSDLTPGTAYLFHWNLHPNDYQVAAGHGLVLVVKSTDDYVVRSPYRATNTLTIGGGASALTLPIIDDGNRTHSAKPPAPWTSG